MATLGDHLRSILTAVSVNRDTISGIANVPPNVFTTVVSIPAGLATSVFGYAAQRNIAGPLIGASVSYAVRLIIGASTEHLYVVRSDNVPWVDLILPVDPGQSIAVQVLHNDALDVLFRAFVGVTLAAP